MNRIPEVVRQEKSRAYNSISTSVRKIEDRMTRVLAKLSFLNRKRSSLLISQRNLIVYAEKMSKLHKLSSVIELDDNSNTDSISCKLYEEDWLEYVLGAPCDE
jgi:hypothetical protein